MWQNRIIGQGSVAPSQIAENPRNWRLHPDRQKHALDGILERVGWVAPIVVNQRTGFLVDGHLRVRLAVERGEAQVPVNYVDLSEDEELQILASLDPISAMAASDAERTQALIDALGPERTDLSQMLAAIQQAAIQHLGEVIARPDFSGVVEQLGPAPANPMTGAKDGNWFYVEYYGSDDTFTDLRDRLSDHMKGGHEIDGAFFARMVRSFTEPA